LVTNLLDWKVCDFPTVVLNGNKRLLYLCALHWVHASRIFCLISVSDHYAALCAPFFRNNNILYCKCTVQWFGFKWKIVCFYQVVDSDQDSKSGSRGITWTEKVYVLLISPHIVTKIDEIRTSPIYLLKFYCGSDSGYGSSLDVVITARKLREPTCIRERQTYEYCLLATCLVLPRQCLLTKNPLKCIRYKIIYYLLFHDKYWFTILLTFLCDELPCEQLKFSYSLLTISKNSRNQWF
jgi:hypothetical protein